MAHLGLVLQIPQAGVNGLFGQGGKRHRGHELRATIRQHAPHRAAFLADQPYQLARLVGRDPAAHDQDNALAVHVPILRSEEPTSELQSLMRISYAVFCLKKKTTTVYNKNITHTNNFTNNNPTIT